MTATLALFGDDCSRLFIDAALRQLGQDSVGLGFFFERLGQQRDRFLET